MKKMVNALSLFGLLLLLASFVLCAQVQEAEESQEAMITLDHLGERLYLPPGEHYTGSFVVGNPSSNVNAKIVSIMLKDFLCNEDGNVSILAPGSLPKNGLADKVDFSPEQLVLQPGEEATVNYEFTVPEGGNDPHWFGLLVREEPESKQTEPGKGELGFAVDIYFQYLFSVIQMCASDCPEKIARLVSMDVSGLMNPQTDSKTLTVAATLENMCEGVLLCTGYIEIRDPSGETIIEQDLSRFTLFPQTRRIIEIRLDGSEIGSDQYVALCVIDFGGESLIGGQLAFSGKDLFVSSSEP